METLLNSTYNILGFIILLGVLVFIHEFGHFIVAKAFKMRVEIFSIGMGNKIFTFTRGETEYAISLFPLGGYVKLTGQDPREEVPPELEHRSFRNKPLYARAAVVLAGPLFNAVLALLVFTLLYATGAPAVAPVIERVLPGSPAEQAGFKQGDEVLAVSKTGSSFVQKIYEYSDLERIVGESPDQELVFQIKRPDQESIVNIRYTPEFGRNRDSLIAVITERGVIKGVENTAPGPTFVIMPGSFAESRLLPSPLWVSSLEYSVNGENKLIETKNIFEFESAWKAALDATGDVGEIKLLASQIILQDENNSAASEQSPKQEEKSYTLAWLKPSEKPSASIRNAGFYSSELMLTAIKPESPAEKFGLKKGDILSTFNGDPIHSFSSFKENLQELAKAGVELRLGWLRDGQYMDSEIKPEIVQGTDPYTEAKNKQFQIGAYFLALPAPPTLKILKAENFIEAIALGTKRSVRLTKSMLSSFYHMAKGDISPKSIGGPISIFSISGRSLKQGYSSFLNTMAFISLNLFILNLLPIPVLDGGHLVMYFVEAIRRKPLSIRFIEIWQNVGVFLLLGLMVWATTNDIRRLIF